MENDSAMYYFTKTISESDNPRNLVTPNQGIGNLKFPRENIKKRFHIIKRH